MLINGNALHIPLSDASVHCVITSPPYYGLRDYGVEGQIGLEDTVEGYVSNLVSVFREVHRVLRDDGTLWLNLGDSYATAPAGNKTWGDGVGSNKNYEGEHIHSSKKKSYGGGIKEKDLLGIPWRVALALQSQGWYLRSDIIWAKPNPMPESITDRPTKSHEYVFLLTKQPRYYYDAEAIKEPLDYPNETRRPLGSKGAWQMDGREKKENGGGEPYEGYPTARNKRSVWTISTHSYRGAHFATFPPKLIEPMILAGTSEYGCCGECGTPYSRIVERISGARDDTGRTHSKTEQRMGKTPPPEKGWQATYNTTGWKVYCGHVSNPVPALILDPFGGSGTVAEVAQRLGRRAVLLELKMEYVQLQKKRLAGTQPGFPMA